MRWTLPLALAFGLGFELTSPFGAAQAGTGACCLDDCIDPRFCEIMTEEDCEKEPGANYLGDGTTCEECPMPSDVPDPSQCTVVPADGMNGLLVCPPVPSVVPGAQITVTARSVCGLPYVGASVYVLLTASNPLCSTSAISGTTNGEGEVVLTLPASGCRSNQPLTALIKVNGVTIRSYANAKSPDWDADGTVGLGDLQQFAREFLGQTADRCLDFDNDGATGLSDLVPFGVAFMHANHCAP